MNSRALCIRCIPEQSLHRTINGDDTKKRHVQKAVCNCVTCSITDQALLALRSAAKLLRLDPLCQNVLVLSLLGEKKPHFVPCRVLGGAVFAHLSDLSPWGLHPPPLSTGLISAWFFPRFPMAGEHQAGLQTWSCLARGFPGRQ